MQTPTAALTAPTLTLDYLRDQEAKCRDAISFGVNTKGNLDWAKAKLAFVQAYLAKHYAQAAA